MRYINRYVAGMFCAGAKERKNVGHRAGSSPDRVWQGLIFFGAGLLLSQVMIIITMILWK